MRLTFSPVLTEHAEESAFLWLLRANAVHAPNYSTQQLADLDERLEAHIDGLRVAGDEGWQLAEAALKNEGPEDFFPATVLAVEAKDKRFDAVIERATGLSEVVPGLISALGWVETRHLTGRVKSMLEDTSPLKQKLGIAACAVHRKDPGTFLDKFLSSPAATVRTRALRTTGELGRKDLLPQVLGGLSDAKKEARFWSARSAVLLGDRERALDALVTYAIKSGDHQLGALQLVLQASDVATGEALLQQLPTTPDVERLRIIGAGYIGNSHSIPWLIEQMKLPLYARVAAEAFVRITGADFNLDQLEALPPADFEEGPTDDPDDENVELPEDLALPWPNVERVAGWWKANSARFENRQRYFLGEAVSTPHCIRVLREGFQRQRIAASLYLTLLQPGKPLFPTSAPAWRQQEWLNSIS